LAALAAVALPVRAADRSVDCAVTASASTTVAAVVDERTLRLADGTEVRLAGIEGLTDIGNTVRGGAAAIRAKAELERLVRSQPVDVRSLGEDRYGRRVALVAVANAGAPPLQEQMIARGHAIAAARIVPAACAVRFLAAERDARAAHLGLWADPPYVIRKAEPAAGLSGTRGRFAVVEGTVLSVNDRGATVYVNFGRRWSEDFTVTIGKRNIRNFVAAGLDPRTLAGRRVRVRGWVDERGGPWIEAIRPEQIELAN
jgi:endonuclease YncB( thermonuclease family)